MAPVMTFEKFLILIRKYNKANICAKGKIKQTIFNRDILLQPFLLFFVSIVLHTIATGIKILKKCLIVISLQYMLNKIDSIKFEGLSDTKVNNVGKWRI